MDDHRLFSLRIGKLDKASRDYEGEFWGERDTARLLVARRKTQGNPVGPRWWRRVDESKKSTAQACLSTAKPPPCASAARDESHGRGRSGRN